MAEPKKLKQPSYHSSLPLLENAVQEYTLVNPNYSNHQHDITDSIRQKAQNCSPNTPWHPLRSQCLTDYMQNVVAAEIHDQLHQYTGTSNTPVPTNCSTRTYLQENEVSEPSLMCERVNRKLSDHSCDLSPNATNRLPTYVSNRRVLKTGTSSVVAIGDINTLDTCHCQLQPAAAYMAGEAITENERTEKKLTHERRESMDSPHFEDRRQSLERVDQESPLYENIEQRRSQSLALQCPLAQRLALEEGYELLLPAPNLKPSDESGDEDSAGYIIVRSPGRTENAESVFYLNESQYPVLATVHHVLPSTSDGNHYSGVSLCVDVSVD